MKPFKVTKVGDEVRFQQIFLFIIRMTALV